MASNQVFVLKKEKLPLFLEGLAKNYEVILPARIDDNQDSVQFVPFDDGVEADFSKQPYRPVKEIFFAKREPLMTWDGKKISVPEIKEKPKAVFGLRRCDLSAIHKQEVAFSGEYEDPYYRKRREDAVLIGYHCDEAPTEHCFCGSLPQEDNFDLMLYDRGESYLVEVGSEIGEKLVKRHKKEFEKSDKRITGEDRKIRGLRTLDYSGIAGSKKHKAWDELIEKCLSCSACTAWCPTCYCHEIHDSVEPLDVSKGVRERSWSSCQLQSFTRVAGDEIFRKERRERYLHRIFHQLLYFEEANGEPLCVGCGRCITHCPTRIDFVGALNEISGSSGGGGQ